MKNEIGAQIERPLQNWRPGVVANANRVHFAHDFTDRSEIDNFQEWIGWRFRPRQFGVFAQSLFDCAEVAHVDKIGFQTPAQKNFAQQARRAVIRVHMREDMIARGERLKDCGGGAGAGSERGCTHAAFERADSFFQRLSVGIVVARVHESARISPFEVTFERSGEVDRGRDRAGGGIYFVAGVHGKRFNFHRVSADVTNSEEIVDLA